jgi:hybrid cluster-associated redox disulfide protein
MKSSEKSAKNGRGIVKSMSLAEVLDKNPKAVDILQEKGMHCIGCMMAEMESLESGCLAHGMNEKEIDALVVELNK